MVQLSRLLYPFPDFSTLNSHCRLPGVGSFFSASEVTFADQQQFHNNECSIIDESVFDMLLQPIMDTPAISPEEFDKLILFVKPKSAIVDSEQTNQKLNVQKPATCSSVKTEPGNETPPQDFVKDYTCSICFKTFSKQQTLDFHMSLHTGERHMCPFPGCNKTFTSEEGLQKHVSGKSHSQRNGDGSLNLGAERSHTPPPKQPTPTPSSSKNGSQQSENGSKPLSASNKNEATVKTEKIVTQKRKSLESRVIETDSDKEFNALPVPAPGEESQIFYDQLVKQIVLDGKTQFKCRKCLHTFTRKADCKCHWLKACPNNPYQEIQCKICTEYKRVFKGISNLIMHLITVHKFIGEHVCLKCHELFRQKNGLKQHSDKCGKGVK